jgi:hypothetical protein
MQTYEHCEERTYQFKTFTDRNTPHITKTMKWEQQS